MEIWPQNKTLMPPVPLEDSYDFCHGLMRSAARNFYYGMRLLPLAKRRAMFALYSFMRLCDDLADGAITDTIEPLRQPQVKDRRQLLESWRQQTHAALAGQPVNHPLWPAFADSAKRFSIPTKLFDDAIDGQLQDLRQNRYDTFADLYQYCYRVASTVGIAAIYIWGFEDERALQMAEHRGIAMQLTNILRDQREDAQRGRQYLPSEDFSRFGLPLPNLPPMSDGDLSLPDGLSSFKNIRSFNSETEVLAAMHLPSGHIQQVDQLLHFQAQRAADYYNRSAELEGLIHADSRPTLRTMTSIYRRILDRIAAQPRRVLFGRVSLSGFEKMRLVFTHAWKARLGTSA